jgi:hypothetical protein
MTPNLQKAVNGIIIATPSKMPKTTCLLHITWIKGEIRGEFSLEVKEHKLLVLLMEATSARYLFVNKSSLIRSLNGL